ncbi:hypothetical protein DFH08DRAFT_965777 [Mycena albidolilacea]|uniref:HAT C-terminal dimerisation domain-containing protein n=1 Tax=Mycena albidolilacea TaxID=1033008 RepID=A0AAD7ELZ5_9AGAR|nr:hypothetical protein DFH08DRAFT_965777 [Mycena albidolilacea]
MPTTTILDPRFNYKKLRKDYANDPDLSEDLETQKKALSRQDLDENYPAGSSTGAAPTASTSALDQGSDDEEDNDELTRYFDAPRAPSHSHSDQLIGGLRIGSVVAVERVFSGGRDIISLRRARLKLDTIRT